MRTEGFSLWKDVGLNYWQLEPIIGWEEVAVMGGKMYLPITPLWGDTKTGKYVMTYKERGEVKIAWTLIEGVLAHYDTFDLAVADAA